MKKWFWDRNSDQEKSEDLQIWKSNFCHVMSIIFIPTICLLVLCLQGMLVVSGTWKCSVAHSLCLRLNTSPLNPIFDFVLAWECPQRFITWLKITDITLRVTRFYSLFLLSGHRKGPRPYFVPQVIFIYRTHTHTLYIYLDSCADILYYCTQLVQMQCCSVFTIHINGIDKHTWTLHFIYI